MSNERSGGRTASRKSKGTFVINGPNCSDCYNRDGSIFSANSNAEIVLNSHFYIERIQNLEKVSKTKKAEKHDREILNDQSKMVEKIANIATIKQKSVTKIASKVNPNMTDKVVKTASPMQKLNTHKNTKTKEESRTQDG